MIFSASGRSDESRYLALFCSKGNIIQDLFTVIVIGEGNMVKGNVIAIIGQLNTASAYALLYSALYPEPFSGICP